MNGKNVCAQFEQRNYRRNLTRTPNQPTLPRRFFELIHPRLNASASEPLSQCSVILDSSGLQEF
jgi:hypothetical protein